MIILYDFRCENQHIEEHLVERGTDTAWCACGSESKRIISPVRSMLDGNDEGFPSAHMKWVREHEKAGGQV
jgi:hypothetical protein